MLLWAPLGYSRTRLWALLSVTPRPLNSPKKIMCQICCLHFPLHSSRVDSSCFSLRHCNRLESKWLISHRKWVITLLMPWSPSSRHWHIQCQIHPDVWVAAYLLCGMKELSSGFFPIRVWMLFIRVHSEGLGISQISTSKCYHTGVWVYGGEWQEEGGNVMFYHIQYCSEAISCYY